MASIEVLEGLPMLGDYTTNEGYYSVGEFGAAAVPVTQVQAVQVAQLLLKKAGLYTGEVDGSYSGALESAFQTWATQTQTTIETYLASPNLPQIKAGIIAARNAFLTTKTPQTFFATYIWGSQGSYWMKLPFFALVLSGVGYAGYRIFRKRRTAVAGCGCREE